MGALASLTRLSLQGVSFVAFAGLAQLTALQELSVDGYLSGTSAELAVLAALPRLRLFRWLNRKQPPADADAALPGGPWLASLESLIAVIYILANSLPVLAAATQLQLLGIGGTVTANRVFEVIAWASQCSSLRHVLFSGYETGDLNVLLEAQRGRPDVRFEDRRDFASL